MPDDRPMDRRRFFRQGLRELLRPMSKAIEPIHRVADELGRLDPILPPEPPHLGTAESPLKKYWLRPPGALVEQKFLDTCSRCGKCAEVCPVQCIKLDLSRAKAGGAPYIDIDTMPCIACGGLDCMHHCPSGALLPTPRYDIDMGMAVWHEAICVRQHGEACTMCVDHCPVGSVALEIIDNRVVVHEDGCIGCGMCQNNCPTDPKSITVTPRSARDAVI